VILPPTEFIDQAHISNPCTRPSSAKEGARRPQCSASPVFTSLLAKPLEGAGLLPRHGGARELPRHRPGPKGRIHIVLAGYVDHTLAEDALRWICGPLAVERPPNRPERSLEKGIHHVSETASPESHWNR
jgi:hypothetical protein